MKLNYVLVRTDPIFFGPKKFRNFFFLHFFGKIRKWDIPRVISFKGSDLDDERNLAENFFHRWTKQKRSAVVVFLSAVGFAASDSDLKRFL